MASILVQGTFGAAQHPSPALRSDSVGLIAPGIYERDFQTILRSFISEYDPNILRQLVVDSLCIHFFNSQFTLSRENISPIPRDSVAADLQKILHGYQSSLGPAYRPPCCIISQYNMIETPIFCQTLSRPPC
ncbi:hypothetical protein CEXT_95071 [Caerostris extrusa]|uniref:Uncharacterized protein n=1 Tax=Caerostris extrusa TaxID=172846 RepID=A0AAV4PDU8_CAEEX|nr:hypothetical protein CEXT_95071 [Caerostris extrusa]